MQESELHDLSDDPDYAASQQQATASILRCDSSTAIPARATPLSPLDPRSSTPRTTSPSTPQQPDIDNRPRSNLTLTTAAAASASAGTSTMEIKAIRGFLVWLKYVPDIRFRTDNEPFKAAMEKFTWKIVTMMKAEWLFEPQGGRIILAQIENEFGPLAPAKTNAAWAADMAVGLDTGVPWVMCKEDDAPNPVVTRMQFNTCAERHLKQSSSLTTMGCHSPEQMRAKYISVHSEAKV